MYCLSIEFLGTLICTICVWTELAIHLLSQQIKLSNCLHPGLKLNVALKTKKEDQVLQEVAALHQHQSKKQVNVEVN
jgi:hypothetical protein